MNYYRSFSRINPAENRYLSAIFLAIAIVISAAPVSANCADAIASLELVESPMKRLWQQLQQQTQFPWGNLNPYQKLSGNAVELNANFDRLIGKQKLQVLAALKLGYDRNWFDLLTPAEQTAALAHPGIGAMSPFQVYASDGRAVSLPYDGCTRTTLLTEKDRFSWYYNALDRSPNSRSTPTMLRNVDSPPWRQMRWKIAAQRERTIRQQFWHTVGMSAIDRGWWIAWVPEQGYFEINVPTDYQSQMLQRFLRVAPRQYRYRVVATDGTSLNIDR
jgi:hypothetical protein